MPETTRRLILALVLLSVCLAFRDALERDPVTHVLVQLPLLAAAGWLAAGRLGMAPAVLQRVNRGGVPGLLIALFAMAYWMLPRSIDAALDSPLVEAAKLVTVPLLIGAASGLSWPRAHPLLRGFLMANALSMLGILAFLYTHAPVRICNNYLVGDQERLGIGFLCAALALALAWTIPLFVGPRRDDTGAFTRARRTAS